ncbi:MAG: DUF438 domain-containing protein [Myxococcota bacterium]
MKLTMKTRIGELVDKYPFLVEFLAEYNKKYELLKVKAFRNTLAKFATIKKASIMGGVSLNELLKAIKSEIERQTGENVEVELIDDNLQAEKLKRLKEIIKRLHEGRDVVAAKEEFNRLIGEIDPSEIAEMEEELIKDGLPVSDIHHLCELHVEVMKGGLEDEEVPQMPPGHPVHTYIAENEALIKAADALNKALAEFAKSQDGFDQLKDKLEILAKVETHYVRKENQLFPYLEKRGITGPPKVMWAAHDDIRALIKESRAAIERKDREKATAVIPKLSRLVVEMVFKENKILFPMALTFISEEEWVQIRQGDDEVGYIFVTPGNEWHADKFAAVQTRTERTPKDKIALDVGELTAEQLRLMLTTIPVDVSFVDENDEVRYYTDSKHRIFPRSPGVIGRKVQNCHPPKSVHIVNRILDEFKAGTKDEAEFWIESRGRFIHIRYLPVRNKEGKYLGTIEFMQDATEIRTLKGERRLLNWEEKE